MIGHSLICSKHESRFLFQILIMMTGSKYEKQAIVTLTSLNDSFPEKYLAIKQGA